MNKKEQTSRLLIFENKNRQGRQELLQYQQAQYADTYSSSSSSSLRQGNIFFARDKQNRLQEKLDRLSESCHKLSKDCTFKELEKRQLQSDRDQLETINTKLRTEFVFFILEKGGPIDIFVFSISNLESGIQQQALTIEELQKKNEQLKQQYDQAFVCFLVIFVFLFISSQI